MSEKIICGFFMALAKSFKDCCNVLAGYLENAHFASHCVLFDCICLKSTRSGGNSLWTCLDKLLLLFLNSIFLL